MPSVTLETPQWAVIINLLAEAPFRQSAPLILEIQRQVSAEPEPMQPAAPARPRGRPRGNGSVEIPPVPQPDLTASEGVSG